MVDYHDFPEIPVQTEEELAAQKKRNLWLGLALGGFVILVAVISAIRLIPGGGAT